MGERASIDLQPRDMKLLRGLFESRIMTLSHIATLYFDGKKEMAKKRVQKLKAAGFVRERPRGLPTQPSILFLARPAFRVLSDHGKLSDYPRVSITDLEKRVQVSEQKLRHELDVMDVKAAMIAAINDKEDYRVAEFSTWPFLYEFEACSPNGVRDRVQPDAFIRMHQTQEDRGIFEHTFFLEVDRSSEAQKILANRAHCYGDYFRSGGFAVRNGRPREEYKHFGFRVLVVCKTVERRNNTAERLLLNNPPIRTQVWLTTFEEVTSNPLGLIWIHPAGYDHATKGTPFDPRRNHDRRMYRSQPDRERLVRESVQKLSVLENLKEVA